MARRKSSRRMAAQSMAADARQAKDKAEEKSRIDKIRREQAQVARESAALAGSMRPLKIYDDGDDGFGSIPARRHVPREASTSGATGARGEGYEQLPSCFGARIYAHEYLVHTMAFDELDSDEQALYLVLLMLGALGRTSASYEELYRWLNAMWAPGEAPFYQEMVQLLAGDICNVIDMFPDFTVPPDVLAAAAPGEKLNESMPVFDGIDGGADSVCFRLSDAALKLLCVEEKPKE